MERAVGKRKFLRSILVRLLLLCVFIVALRFAYVVSLRGESCDFGDFCFFSLTEDFNIVAADDQVTVASSEVVFNSQETVPSTSKKIPDLWTTEGFQKAVNFYSSIFQDLISEGFLSYNSKSLCVETPTGADVFALRENGVDDSIGIFKKPAKPLVVSGEGVKQPFADEEFDFVFCGGGVVEKSMRPGDFAAEIGRTLKPDGFLVVHTASKDKYSFASFLDLFNCCKLVKTKEIQGRDPDMPFVREIVMQKEDKDLNTGIIAGMENSGAEAVDNCFVSNYRKELIQKAEPLIDKEPLKPWITLKENLWNIKYLSSMVDISFKRRYVYIDVGARSYGSSIVSWFKKQYPKQNKTFDIYAIEADKSFHDEYKYKKGVTLLPYAAWIRNETLFFEINRDPGHKEVEKGRGMGRIRPVQSSGGSGSSNEVDEIQGLDFADWLKNTVSENDYVVMKMDVEGTEFDLIPKLFETGAICLIDEIFLECHYNRWQRCCAGERTTKYQKTYGQCLRLFTSLRKSGVLVHQWW